MRSTAIIQTNVINRPRTILQRLEKLDTRFVCASCGSLVAHSPCFDPKEMTKVIDGFTGSCPTCRHPFQFRPELVKFNLKP